MKNGYKKILLVTDGSPAAQAAEQTVFRLALRDDAEVVVADTIRSPGRVEKWLLRNSQALYETLENEKRDYLNKLSSEFSGQGVGKTSAILLHGKSSDELTREVMRQHCDLLVRYRKGTDSRQPGLLGKTAVNLLRVCPCPVLLVKERQTFDQPNVFACVDIQDDDLVNNEILQAANRINGDSRPGVGVLYCWSMFGHELIRRRMNRDSYQQLVKEITSEHEHEFDQFLMQRGIAHSDRTVIKFGDPEYVIPAYVRENSIDISVMSTIAPTTAVSRLLGSTIENVLGDLSSNLLAVKPLGFVSPISLPEIDPSAEANEDQPISLPLVI